MGAVGRAVVDRKTKKLLQRLKPGEIAVIYHKDIDELAAKNLVKSKVKGVINFQPSMSGRFFNQGPAMLLDAGIPVVDVSEEELFDSIRDGDIVQIKENGEITVNGRFLCKGVILSQDLISSKLEEAKANFEKELEKFAVNTLEYIRREKTLLSSDYTVPRLKTDMHRKHVMVVVRGKDYREDLLTLRSYIEEIKPVLIGVDGGADALLEFGLKPNVIIGDMDSISDKGLMCGAEIVVHAYPDGRAPGLDRVKKLGLDYHIMPVTGTSEDAALLLAYHSGADLIVAVGTHNNIIDFLEKGRQGMASTFLVRLKVGHILIDAKGVNKLYKGGIKINYIAALFVAAFFPIFILGTTSPAFRHLLRLILLKVKLMIGFL
ncbi:putative cytokinetic ring protein SteA [Thermosediminibacter oceani]|uniref:Thiamin pyrophosphokinase catalytic region n=1 Tax=Thermosediminibacter oceani (strain ATCC BAA-1034 / DSM 16646 / JW/IW-1228P) TaxID=555079 RepID=D9S3Q7_THEOJ|nr:putative cytokinetic ring protein SteA [Thermosediminibacter oceani]ADL08034.1 Thiamin pyrophosphokinase catalytic region [Thermosediminibacter oceani DSM 16646]